MARTICISIRW